MIALFVRGLLAGYGIAIPVGAIAILIMDTAMRRGFRNGFAAGAGAATADLIFAAVAVGAGSLIVPFLTPLAIPLRIASGAVLITLAIMGFVSPRSAREAVTPANGEGTSLFVRFITLTLVNPLTVVYFAALVLGGSATDLSAGNLVAFALGAFAASLSWQTLLALIGTALGAVLSPKMRLVTGALGNTMVMAFGLMIFARTADGIM